MAKLIDIVGQKFGRLTVISRAENGKTGQPRWNCKCDCGGETTVWKGNLLSGRTKSCGCLNKELAAARHRTHGMFRTPIYKIWAAMKSRCYNENNPRHKDYGGRGITVCERWNKFENFYAEVRNQFL